MKKEAFYDAKTKGFKSRAQMRLLLDWARKDPSKYSWAIDILREHGVPDREESLNTYWEAPYNISPDTPSYVYKSKRSSFLGQLTKFADALDEKGFHDQAEKIDSITIPKAMLDDKKAKEAAYSFWSLWKNDLKKTPEGINHFFEVFNKSSLMQKLNSASQIAAEQYLSDKVKEALEDTSSYEELKVAQIKDKRGPNE